MNTPRLLLTTIALVSAIAVSSQTNIDSIRQLSLDSLTHWLETHYQELESYDIAKSALQRAVDKKDTTLQIRLLENIYDWSLERTDPQTLLNNYKPILPLYRETNQLQLYGDRLCNISDMYLNVNKTDSSQIYIFEAIEVYKSIEDLGGEGIALLALTNLTSSLKDFHKSNNYAEEAINALTIEEDYVRIALCHMEKTRNFIQLKDYNTAIISANKGLALCKKYRFDRYELIRSLLYGERGNAYLEQKKYNLAFADFEKESEYNLASSLYNRGNVHFKKKEYKLAAPYFVKYLNVYEEAYEDSALLDELQKLVDCYEKSNQSSKAYPYLKRLQEGQAVSFKTKINTLESDLIVKYEAAQKDEAITNQRILLDQKSQNNKILSVLTFALFLSFIALLYYFRKNKSNLTQLKAKSRQNETLLKEIHHRVKNNLQTISSLLYLQSANITDVDAKEAIAQGQHRVESMALIHKNLYMKDNLAGIEMKDYLTRLTSNLKDFYIPKDTTIAINLNMEPAEIDVDTAIPLGLITNELLTNTFKYAFPNKKSGQVDIDFIKIDQSKFYLKIKDNGIGKDMDSSGFGSQLVALLSRQLEATFKDGNNNGYWCELTN